MTRKQFIAAMKREQKVLAASRDNLRDLLSEIETIEWDATEGLDSLERAIDALSRNQ